MIGQKVEGVPSATAPSPDPPAIPTDPVDEQIKEIRKSRLKIEFEQLVKAFYNLLIRNR